MPRWSRKRRFSSPPAAAWCSPSTARRPSRSTGSGAVAKTPAPLDRLLDLDRPPKPPATTLSRASYRNARIEADGVCCRARGLDTGLAVPAEAGRCIEIHRGASGTRGPHLLARERDLRPAGCGRLRRVRPGLARHRGPYAGVRPPRSPQCPGARQRRDVGMVLAGSRQAAGRPERDRPAGRRPGFALAAGA